MIRKIIRGTILTLALLILAFSVFKLVDYYRQGVKSDAVIQEIAPQNAGDSIIDVDFDLICEKYPDVCAWIYQPGTNINYPVVRAEDNDFYLRRLLDGSYNVNGTLFMDYRCAADLSDFCTIIYGHNMKNGKMFASFPEYASQEYFDAHPFFFLDTPDGMRKINLISAFLTDDTDEIYAFPENEEGAAALFNLAREKSGVTSPISEYNGEHLVILSTCSYEKSNARFVLVGVLE